MFSVEYGFPVDLVNILVNLYVTKTRYSMEILNRNRNKPKKKYYIEIEEKNTLYIKPTWKIFLNLHILRRPGVRQLSFIALASG